MERRNLDRRLGDRRSSNRQPKETAPKPWLFALLVSLMFVGSLAFAIYGTTQVASATTATESNTKTKREKKKSADYSSFREEIRRKDVELVERYHAMKQARRVETDPSHAREHYERRLAQMEADMEQNLTSQSVDKEGSLGWQLKHDIERYKIDAPPEF